MIEIKIKDFLKEKLQIDVFMEHIKNMPEKFVIFEKVGSKRKNYINISSFAFQSYADSLYKASELNEKLKNAVFEMDLLDDIVSIKLDSDYNFTDTETKRYRYQVVFDIVHY